MTNLASHDAHVNKSGYIVASQESGQIVPYFHSFKYAEAEAYTELLPGHSVRPWMKAHTEELAGKGYRLIPRIIKGDGTKTPLPYGDGQTYSLNEPVWERACDIAVAVPQDCILIDRDGYKDGCASMEEIAKALGLTVDELKRAKVQSRDDSDSSLHWLFRLPSGYSVKASTGEWLPYVDIKANSTAPSGTANGLIHVKPGKIIEFPNISDIQQLDVTRITLPFPVKKQEQPRTTAPRVICDLSSAPGKRALTEKIKELQAATDGSRNNTLNIISMQVGHYVGAGDISQQDAAEALLDGALAIGLDRGESVGTIESGLKAGIAEPRLAPRTVAEKFATSTVEQLPQDTVTAPITRTGFQYLAGSQLLDHFKGCVYVADLHVVLTPNGQMLKPESYNALYGGYVFALDADGGKSTTKAFEAFTLNQAFTFPKVNTTVFDPSRPFGTIMRKNGIPVANTYLPCPGERKKGDPAPFLNHIAKLLPVATDREILLDWMAYKAQNPAQLMRWAVVLCGVEGNGKTTVGEIMRYTVGERYSEVVQSHDIDNKFNGWACEKLLAVINDFKIGDRRDVMEVLKPIITDSTIPVQKKGKDTRNIANHLGFVITSNHKNAVVKTSNDRRYAVFYTAQQSEQDLTRDCMNGDYFSTYYDWLEGDGYAIVADYLHSRIVSSHPNRAPVTSSMAEAIRESMTPTQAAITEAVDDELPGFRNDIIVSTAARRFLDSRNLPCDARIINNVLRELGYSPIPGSESWRLNGTRFTTWRRGAVVATLSREEVMRLSGYTDNHY